MSGNPQHKSNEQQQLAAAVEFNAKLADVSSRFRALNVEIVALLKTHPSDPKFCAKLLHSQGLTEAQFIACGDAALPHNPARN